MSTTYIISSNLQENSWNLFSGVKHSVKDKKKHDIEVQKNLSKDITKKLKKKNTKNGIKYTIDL